jgi:hypothetical protein
LSEAGILGRLFEPQKGAWMFDARHLVFDIIGPQEFVSRLTSNEQDSLSMAILGYKSREEYDTDGNYLYQKVAADIRRDAARERVWALEAFICAEFPDEVMAELQRGRSAVTKRHYEIDVLHWKAWCKEHEVPALPAEPATLASYILTLKPTTVVRRLAALAAWHSRSGYLLPRKSPLVRVALNALRQKKPSTETGETNNGEKTGL